MKAIRILRAEAGITETELGKRSGVAQYQISRIEHGHVRPTAPTVGKLAVGLGVGVAQVYMLDEWLSGQSRVPDASVKVAS